MIQLTRNSPTNAYIAQKTVLRENRVMRNRVMRGLGVFVYKIHADCLAITFFIDVCKYVVNESSKNIISISLQK